ncbi:MAG: GMC family oxidoreductase N-terminal domain-containing protein [Betaproteobacteria bacterium]|nr:GMC family oxidoreductase N-terminal domain-containing protein [Betaproteobacteria bacterium]
MTGKSWFDYIIVGSGTAGCILANRLSADPRRRVLLLEAGPSDRDWLLHIPLGVGEVWNAPRFNWPYTSEPEPHLDSRRLRLPRGKVLGGSSSINMMAYVRGHRGDFDRWDCSGLPGWSYAEVLPYFRRSETFLGGEDRYRGGSGPMLTQSAPHGGPLYTALADAVRSTGVLHTDDYNGAQQEGLGLAQFSIGKGRRQGSASCFLRPALRRPNMSLCTGAHVRRILFEGRKAVGVEYEANGTVFRVWAGKEVLLAAGAYNTPHLLMLSGVGPIEQLKRLGIDPVLDVPGVGVNLQDHIRVAIEYERTEPSAMHRNLRLDRLAFNMARALFLRSGPATEPLSTANLFVRSLPHVPLPDLQIIFRLFHPGAHPWFPHLKRPAIDGFGFVACLLRPVSRGSVKLTSPDPRHPPLILHNHLAVEADMETLVRSVRLVRRLAIHPGMTPHWRRELTPGNAVANDDEIRAFIRAEANTIFHPVGTCRMGGDPGAVVTSELRVRGVDNLRVVDASVMPDLIGGNTNAAVMMIAEKAADLILGRPALLPADV